MLEKELLELNESIPEFSEKDMVKNNILKLHKDKTRHAKKRLTPKFVLNICIAMVLLLCFVFIGIGRHQSSKKIDIGISALTPHSIDKIDKEYIAEQKRRESLYSNISKNYYSKYLLSKNESESEYIDYLINQNKQLEEEQVIENIYYEVTIDYCMGETPQKVIVKKGECIYPEVFNYSGHYFSGWFINEEKITSAIPVNGDVRIYAKWAEKESITMDGNYYEYYEDIDGAVIVKAIIKDSEIIEVPTYIGNLKVIGLVNSSYSAYRYNNQYLTKKIIVSEYVRFITAGVFSFYYELEELYLPRDLEELYGNAFTKTGNLQSIHIDEENQNYKVINQCLIDLRTNSLVKGCKNSVIPEEVQTIDRFAFSDVKDIYEIHIPNNVTKMNGFAFSECPDLEKVILPENLTFIDEMIFSNCKNLREVYIGSKVKEISTNTVFSRCEQLEKIIVSSDNPYFESVDGCLIEKETGILLCGVNIDKIPENVKIIGESAFSGRKNLTSIVIGDNVHTIQEAAFVDCSNLQKVEIANSVTKIYGYCFAGCSSLETIVLPQKVELFGGSMFSECEKLREITLPQGLSRIPVFTFFSCHKLEKIVFQTEVTSIGVCAFEGCSSLEPFDLSKVKIIEDSAFSSCSLFKTIDLSSAKEIGHCAFEGCRGLEEVFIPSSVEKIGERAFGYCKNAILYCEDKEIKSTWDSNFSYGTKCYFGVPFVVDYENCTYRLMENGTLELIAYRGNDKVVTIPETVNSYIVTSIGKIAFQYKKIEEVILPNTIEIIKEEAFSYCYELKSITQSDHLKTIEKMAFWQCNKLRNVELNEGLEYIGISAFGSTDLLSIVLPSTLKKMEQYAFSDNKYLVEVCNLSHLSNLQGATDNAIQVFTTLDYKSGIIKTEDGFIFYYNPSTDEVTLVEYVGNEIFLTLPKTVKVEVQEPTSKNQTTQYEKDMLDGHITVVKEYPYNIGTYAFYSNHHLVKVEIPNTVSSIGKRAFFDCRSLTSIVIPESITELKGEIFLNCDHLYEVYNLSSLNITLGNTGYGSAGLYAKNIYTSRDVESKVVDGNNGFVYYVNNDDSYIVYYYYNEATVIFPNDIFGYTYSIASDVFNGNTTIESVQFSNNLIGINYGAFSNCINLKKVVIPSSVTFIGRLCFYQSGIEEVVFEDPNGWYSKESSTANIIEHNLSNPTYNAKYLSHRAYYFLDWHKRSTSDKTNNM